MSVTIALADDHSLIRQSIAEALSGHEQYKVTLQASDGPELIAALRKASTIPDICILDYAMPEMDGIEAMKIVRREFPGTRNLILSMYMTEFNIVRAFKSGADGVFPKKNELDELLRALDCLVNEAFYIPDDIPSNIAAAIRRKSLVLPNITSQELRFLQLCCQDFTYSAIAQKMGLSEKTVIGYSQSLFAKLNITSKTGLVIFAIKTGLCRVE